jgi:hypothetical protein
VSSVHPTDTLQTPSSDDAQDEGELASSVESSAHIDQPQPRVDPSRVGRFEASQKKILEMYAETFRRLAE